MFNILCTKIYKKYFVLQGKIDIILFFKTFFNFGVLFGVILDACGVQCYKKSLATLQATSVSLLAWRERGGSGHIKTVSPTIVYMPNE